MDEETGVLSGALRANIPDILGEEFLVEALREVLKDEVKFHIQQELEENPELKEELTDAVQMYFEARVRENYASLKLAKASGELGVQVMPEELRDELGGEFVTLIEREVTQLLDKAL
jgi:hypothetical protein